MNTGVSHSRFCVSRGQNEGQFVGSRSIPSVVRSSNLDIAQIERQFNGQDHQDSTFHGSSLQQIGTFRIFSLASLLLRDLP